MNTMNTRITPLLLCILSACTFEGDVIVTTSDGSEGIGTDDPGADENTGPGATSTSSGSSGPSDSGRVESSDDTGTATSESTDSSGSSGSSGDSTTGEPTCKAQPRPYGECDLSCGAMACDNGRTCIGDPITGEAACADPCEAAATCPFDLYPEPWAIPVCQPAPASGVPGSWCGIACAGDADACPNVTVCTDLGGDEPLCIGGQ